MNFNKIKTDKEFNEFIKYLKDENKQEERKEIYAELDDNLLIGKAQFIASQTSSYINLIMSGVLENASGGLFSGKSNDVTDIKADLDNQMIADIIKLQNILAKLKAVLPEEQQETVLGKTLNSFGVEDLDISAKDCLDAILSFKSGLSDCTKKIFDIIIRDIEIKKYVDVDNFNNQLEKPEALKLIEGSSVKDNKNKKDAENVNSVGLLLNILSNQTKGLNTENLAKMYAYINSGWAGVDLGSLSETKSIETINCHSESKMAKKLFDILKDIKNNPDDKFFINGTTSLLEINSSKEYKTPNAKVVARKQLLHSVWVDRLKEITIDLTFSNMKGTIKATNSTVSNDSFSASGQPDIVIQKYNSNDLLAVNATALKNLSYNEDSAHCSSILRHSYALKNLSGKYVHELGVGDKNITNQEGYHLRKYMFNVTHIGKVEYNLFGLASVLSVNDTQVLSMFKSSVNDVTKKTENIKPLSQKEVEIINTHHLIERVLDYSHVGFVEEGQNKTTLDIKMSVLDIATFVTLGNKQNVLGKMKLHGTDFEKLSTFTNDFLVQYFKSAAELISSRKLNDVDGFSYKYKSNEGIKQNILPFVIKMGRSLISNGSDWKGYLTLNSKMELLETLDKLVSCIPKAQQGYKEVMSIEEYPYFTDNTLRGEMNFLVSSIRDFKERFKEEIDNNKKNDKIKTKINGLMKKIVKAKIVPNIAEDIADIPIAVINKVKTKKKSSI